MTPYPPVAVFAYNRKDEIERSLLSLNANYNSEKFCVYFCDGPKSISDERAVLATRKEKSRHLKIT